MTPLPRFFLAALAALFFLLAGLFPRSAHGEAMLQYFNTSWNEIAQRMPELAEAGYQSIWLPPPTKGSGGLSVGYDLWDRFDLGGKDQRNTVSTRYGTEADLLRLIETAHRFGIRIYLDNIANHNAFDVPGYNESTPVDIYPGFVPEDFHLRLTADGSYRKWDNTRDWNSAWQVQHLGLADLIDIAQEPGGTNENFGASEGSTFPKIKFVRQPNNPEYYCYKWDGTYVGFGAGNGLTVADLQAHADFYSERVEDFLNRAARWEIDRTKADGLRLDAVKHVRADFFGATYGADKDFNDYGYTGQVQRQFNLTRGFNDAKFNFPGGDTFRSNLRESVFDTEKPRHNAMMFGEHLGEPPSYSDYFDAGMRLVDNTLRNNMNNVLGNPSASLYGLDQPGSFGFAPSLAVTHAQSHDNDYSSRRELQHALYFTRAGLPLIYTDGNHQAQTLGESGGAFPRHANTNFLGQFGDARIPNLLYIHDHFARGTQTGRFGDSDVVAYERIDKRENTTMSDADGATLLFLLNDNYANGQGRSFTTSFGHTPFSDDSYLYNYSTYGGGFYKWASEISNGSTIVPPGGYFAFSWRNPEASDLWSNNGGKPLTILQNGQPAGTMTYLRKDGPDGDPNYNPNSVAGATAGSYSYPCTIPRVTSGSDLSFIARADGSAENVLIALDGGVDVNSQIPLGPTTGEKRDHPPGLSTDVFLGFEQAQFAGRQYGEKFAAIDTARCTFGSAGAETYLATSGTYNAGPASANSYDTEGGNVASWLYHDPRASTDQSVQQYIDNGGTVTVWAKTNSVGAGYRMWFYYTGDGTNPEGAGGVGLGTTQVVEMHYNHNDTGNNNWWASSPPITKPAGQFRYKISIAKDTTDGNAAHPVPSIFPSGPTPVLQKKHALTTFQIPHFNATTALIYPHNDYGATQTGLSEGFHFLRARAFLNRPGRASIYNTYAQTFYYDALPPAGEIKFPAENDTLGDSRYGVVVRTDPSVTEVWYHITDGDAANDDISTHTSGGNGVGFEPFTDSNGNGIHDAGEAFEDLNGNGVWDGNVTTSWVRATEVTPSASISSDYPREWRFDYTNIPSTGAATIQVRLRELSSSAYKDFSLTDAAGHFTTLTRTVNARGPDTKMFVAYPAQQGDVVDSSYVMKVWFSRSLANGTNLQQLISRFLVKIKSSDSSSDPGVTQAQSSYSINYNIDGANGQYHELALPLPNLYNGDPNFLHTIDVVYTNPGAPTLEAMRKVKAKAVVTPKDNIVNPPEVDSDGKTYQIILPDVASPTAAQRTVPIRVETDLAATDVQIAFTLGSGTVALNPASAQSPNPSTSGASKFWDFTWSGVTAGDYQFTASVFLNNGSSASATAVRNAHVVFRQIVAANANKEDVDDDGLGYYDPGTGKVAIETTKIPLPSTNSETWTNGQVHLWTISGKTQPLTPDSDGDGMSDGLELGWGNAVGDTNATTDTNGDGVPNFQPDEDPPIFNTTDNSSRPADYALFDPWPYNLNRSRTDLIAGTMTDPNKADTDDDGLDDSVEDSRMVQTGTAAAPVYTRNFNGRVDIVVPDAAGTLTAADGSKWSFIKHPPTIYNTSQIDRTKVPANAVWLETDPNNPDTDGDGIPDGQEDANHNGRVDLAVIDRDQTDANGNFVVLGQLDDSNALGFGRYHDFCHSFADSASGKTFVFNRLDRAKLAAAFPKIPTSGAYSGHHIDVVWLETDPLNADTDGDGLPDGWEKSHGLDPLDRGAAGQNSLRTGKPSDIANGATGDPDADGFTNLQEYANGTDPQSPDTGTLPPAGSITIGPSNPTTIGGVTNNHEFTDWTADDLIALDEFDGDGPNNQGSDVYHGGDGFDSSRDLVAFYAHDGGAASAGGDGNFYFRVDLQDLQAYAEEGHLDIYVAINFGNPGNGVGQKLLPDDVDTLTNMGWQAVVACYSTNNGRVYLDNPSFTGAKTTGFAQDLLTHGMLAPRDQTSANGFKKAYFNSDLDAVEFSVSRQALLDAGWNGQHPEKLVYQVFTTRDGTGNSPVGAGNISGRSDIRDSIYDDWIASDYYNDQAALAGTGSTLKSWFGLSAGNDRGKRVKVISLLHGNQAIQPGSATQALINNAAGAGYYRPLDAHQAFGVPLAMHITPTLASALQWAKVAPGSARPYRDGPAMNARIASLIGSGTIDLLGSTFSDHVLPYFTRSYNRDNLALANEVLTAIYGSAPSSRVFWTPERVSDAGTATASNALKNDVDGVGVLEKVADMGFDFTFIDQMRHELKWFGRTSALGSDGYRINRINGVNCFSINDGLGAYLFTNDDNGLPVLLRQLFSKKARSSQQDQVVIFVNDWESFGDKTKADAYDKNIRWMASHPWIQIVTPDQIAAGGVDLSQPPDGQGDAFGRVERGTNLTLAKTAKDWIDHATEESYDNWFFGSAVEESLAAKVFNIRSGVPMTRAFGSLAVPGSAAADAWAAVGNISGTNGGNLLKLARGTAHAAAFITGFHDQTGNDLTKYSTGAYLNPDTVFQNLSDFTKYAQSQMRNAAIYARVDAWATAARGGAYATGVTTQSSDVDLDGEPEYLLFNDRIFAIFERLGGRMTHAWARDIDTGEVFQTVGNPLGYSGSETEEEGTAHLDSATGTPAYRTSGFKDWFAQTGGPGVGTNYVNDLYTVAAAPSGTGWKFTSSDGKIVKTITLAPRASKLDAQYALGSGLSQLYVRFGMSPNLYDQIVHGQGNLATVADAAHGEISVLNTAAQSVRAFLKYGGATGLSAVYNSTATDRIAGSVFDTVPMRNQAQTQQLEITNPANTTGMSFSVGFQAGATVSIDSEGAGIPDVWRNKFFGHPDARASDNSRATDDADGDGKTNAQEYILGTDPTVKDYAMPRVRISTNAQSQSVLTISTMYDRAYRVEYAATPAGPWTQAGGALAGNGGDINWTDDGSQTGTPSTAQTRRFYRVQITLP